MPNSSTQPHPKDACAMADEADNGSGEKTPAQFETERMINEIPRLSEGGAGAATPGEPGAAGQSQGALHPSEHDNAAHGQMQREQNASRQDADPGMPPNTAI